MAEAFSFYVTSRRNINLAPVASHSSGFGNSTQRYSTTSSIINLFAPVLLLACHGDAGAICEL
jgi:hypothetical protein